MKCRYSECFKCTQAGELRIGMFMKRQVERCRNPWNGKCDNTNIEVYIYYRGNKLPICRSCWGNIADKNLEW